MPTSPPIHNSDTPTTQRDRREARAMLDEVRTSLPSLQIQGNFCNREDIERIARVTEAYTNEQAPHLKNDLRLMTRQFFSLYRQLHKEADLPDSTLRDVISVLHEELQENATALGTKAYHNITSGTVYHGAVAAQLIERFPSVTKANITKALESGTGVYAKLDKCALEKTRHSARILEEKTPVFISNVRKDLGKRKAVAGISGLSGDTTRQIAAAASNDPDARYDANVKVQLLRLFEEAGSAKGHLVNEEQRPLILTQLLQELSANNEALEGAAPLHHLLASTALRGAIAPSLKSTHPDAPAVEIAKAMRSNPFDPSAVLNKQYPASSPSAETAHRSDNATAPSQRWQQSLTEHPPKTSKNR